MNNIKTTNGRIDIQTPSTKNLFAMYDRIPANQCATYLNSTEGLWDETQLSKSFFSETNIQILQNGIRAGVYEKSNRQYIIGPQDCDSLKIVMRSIFLQYAANQPTNIRQQIQQLNQLVLNYCIQQVYSEAQGYLKYISDASNMYVPLSPPIMSTNNDKELVLKPWF
jgi:hypothetical protein